MNKKQIIIDTNVLVAALRSRSGASFKLIEALGKGLFETSVSTAIILEYEDVLMRHYEELGLTSTDVRLFIDYIVKVSRRVPIHFRWRPFLRDPGDECFLELAVAAAAHSIITYNKRDFTGVDERFGITIMDAREFLIQIGELL